MRVLVLLFAGDRVAAGLTIRKDDGVGTFAVLSSVKVAGLVSGFDGESYFGNNNILS